MKFQHRIAPRQVARAAGLLLVALGVAVLLGWALDVAALKSVLPGMSTMKANTAATMALCGLALALLSGGMPSTQNRRLAASLALLVITMGALTLAEYLLGWQLRIDQVLFRELGGAATSPYPGRMSPSTALSFVFGGTAIWVASFRANRSWRWPILCSMSTAVGVLGATALMAFLFRGAFHLHFWDGTGIAFHTAAGFVVLAVGLLALVRAEGGFQWSLRPSTTVGILLGVSSLLGMALVSNNSTYHLQQDDFAVTHTQEVLKEIEAVLSGMQNLESAQRGYLILGDPRLLASQDQARRAVDADVAQLRALTSDNPQQQRRLDQLLPLIVQRNDWTDRTILARRDAGFTASRNLLAQRTGITLSADIAAVLGQMRDEEYLLLDLGRKQSEATATTTFLLLPLGLFLSLALLSFALFFLNAGVAEQALTESLLRQQASLLDLAPVLVCDMESRIVSWSAGIQKLYGYTREEALGKISHQLLRTDFPIPLAQIERILQNEGTWEGELSHCDRDGNRVLVSSRWVLYRDAQGKPIRILEVNTDITARKRAEALQLRSQKLESLGTLSGGIAHDFNNILLAINGNAKLAIADLPPQHPVQQSLSSIVEAGARATHLVRRILAFSRPQELKQEVIQLQPVVEEALKLLRATLPATIEFRTAFASGLPPVVADSTQVHQVIVNLATNAAHAIRPASGWIEFRLDAAAISQELPIPGLDLPAGRYVRLTVGDSGRGMDRATVSQIFDPFFTTKGPGEGTGLGLSVVHGIMATHKGAVTVYSEPGRGAVFYLYFPASANVVRSARVFPREAPRGHNQRVLYLDDEKALVELIERMLERRGYHVTGFTDPARALEQFRLRPGDFDVVVTDLSMPQMSGFEFAQELLAIRPDTPIVMTSGFVRPEDQDKALRMGLRDLILKPDTVEQLGQTIERIFSQEPTPAKPLPS